MLLILTEKNYKIQVLLKLRITGDNKEWLVIAWLLFKYPQNISYCFKINKEIEGFQKNIQEYMNELQVFIVSQGAQTH